MTWNNIYNDNGKLFCLKTHNVAENPLENLKAAEEPFRPLENPKVCRKTLRFFEELQKKSYFLGCIMKRQRSMRSNTVVKAHTVYVCFTEMKVQNELKYFGTGIGTLYRYQIFFGIGTIEIPISYGFFRFFKFLVPSNNRCCFSISLLFEIKFVVIVRSVNYWYPQKRGILQKLIKKKFLIYAGNFVVATMKILI